MLYDKSIVLRCLFGIKDISGYPRISFRQKDIPWYFEISHEMSISVYVGLSQDIKFPMWVYLSISVDMSGYLKIWFLLCRYMSVYRWICQYEICHPWMSRDILMQPGPGWAGWSAWKLRILHPAAPPGSGAFVAVAWYTRSSINTFIISGALAPPPHSSPPAGCRCLGGGHRRTALEALAAFAAGPEEGSKVVSAAGSAQTTYLIYSGKQQQNSEVFFTRQSFR
jgi:hypothetical protein